MVAPFGSNLLTSRWHSTGVSDSQTQARQTCSKFFVFVCGKRAWKLEFEMHNGRLREPCILLL
eukprot:jgi/Botrbrau1/543/Bobra.0010s0018.1